MANFHLNVTIASRGGGSASAVGSGSYQHNTKMRAEYDGRGFDYSNKNDLVHADLSMPSDVPEWVEEAFGEDALAGFVEAEGSRNAGIAKMSEKLWNDVEHFEAVNNRRHKTAQLARKMRMSLPNGLSRAEHIELGRAYFQKNFTDRGMIVDWVIHHPGAVGGKVDNPHIHALVTMRNIGEDGWGLKNPSWNERGMLASWRFEWANEVNVALERAGLEERVDHRSYKDQGIELKPTSYNPFVAEAVESRGEVARNRDRAMAAKEGNKAYLLENPEHILRVVQAERSVFGVEDVRAAFEKRMGGEVDLDGLTAAAMGSRDIVLVAHLQGDDGGAQYMTKAQASIETNLMVDALELNAGRLEIEGVTDLEQGQLPLGRSGRGDVVNHNSDAGRLGSRSQADAITGVGAGLGEEQVAALVEMVSDRRLSLVTGYAGAGKTRTVGAAAQVWRERGFEVLGGAVAGKATQELMNIEGMTAASLAAWEARWSRGQTPREGRFVFFMDEAGMVGSSHWERVQKRILDMGGKLIAVGDPEQLQPVLDTGAFVALQDQVGVKVIDVVRRMENPLDREATRMFAQGERWARQALEYYKGAGCVLEVSGEGEAFERIVGEYFEKGRAGESRVAAFYTNRDANEGNDLLHARAVELGRVPEASLVDYGLIKRVDRTGLHPKIETAPMIFGAGERVRFTRPHRELSIPKSSFATVLEARTGEMDLLIDGDAGRRVTIDMSAFDHFDYGYGATTHALQGMTVDHVLAVAHPRMTRHVSYVMMSRHAKSVEMVVPTSRFTKIDFEDAATRSGYLNADIEARSERHVVRGQASLPSLTGSDGGEIVQRADYIVESQSSEAGRVLEDAHVSSVFRHYHGLLNAEYIEGEVAAVGDDPHGFVEQPQGVIDHLVGQKSTFAVSDVADALSKVVADPETFARLFYAALEHPDLVVLREDGADGARVYSTVEQAAKELWVMDKGVALAVGSQDPRLEVGEGYVDAALAQGAFDARVAEAVQYAGQGGQVRLITGGSGSGKTQTLGVVAQAHEWAGFDVVAIAPTRRTATQFGMQAGVSSSSFGSLVYGLERGTRHLDENSVIVLDHGELMGLDDAGRLMELVETSGAKLVAGYGQNGLSSISAGTVFGDLAARIDTFELGGSLRLGGGLGRDVFEAVTRDGVATSRRGDVFAEMIARDALVAGGTHDASIEALADAYIADPSSDKVILAQSNKDVVLLNEAVGARLREARRNSDVVRGGDVAQNGDQEGALGAGESDVTLGYDLKALGVGDKVVLTEYYIPGQLQTGEQGVVIEADAQSFTLRLGRVQDERYLTVDRNDAEFSVGLNFAQTIYTAQGQGRSSVHVLGTKGLSREGLSTAVGLHEDALRIVVPAQDTTEAIDIVQAIATRDRQDLTVASYITDHRQACAQVHREATAHFEAERGANNPYAAPSIDALSEDRQATADYLRKTPGHVLTLLGAERSVFSEREIEAALVSRLGGKASDLSGVFDSVMAHPSLVVLDRFGPGGHRLYTTRAHVVRETNLIAEARDAMKVPLELGDGAENFALAPHLGSGQNKAVRAMLNEDRISLVIGYAGTGKTTIVSEAARVWKDRGYDVLGGALSGRATQELSGIDGMEVASLAAWEAKWARGTRPKEGKFVFVMDEAGMVGTDVWARVQSRVLAMGGKLVAVGDPEQLQPISDSNVFKALEAELGARIIEEVRRQNNPIEREYTKQLAHGGSEAVAAIRGYAECGAVVFKDTPEDAIGAIAKEYFKAGSQDQSRRAYAATNADVVALNDSVRAEALRRGVVDPSTVVNYGLIQRINRSGGMERVETAALMLGVGDQVVFTEAHRDLRIPKSSFARVTATRSGEVDLLIEGDDPRAVTLDMKMFNKLDYGFAATIHKGQGDTKDLSFLLGHSIMDRHAHYVGLSRHRDGVQFYVPRTRVANMGALERLVQRNAYQSLAASEIDGAILESSGTPLDTINLGAGDRLDRFDFMLKRNSLPVAKATTGFALLDDPNKNRNAIDRRADQDSAIAVVFESDAHLNSVVNRMTGLLRANYVDGDPALGDDPRGYAQNPRQIIDDLIKQQSTIRAAEVSRVLSGVARAPDTFARLFREAMSHPDLVVLSEDGHNGEGRVYSTKAQVALELDVMDRAVRLALDDGNGHPAHDMRVGYQRVLDLTTAYGFSDEQQEGLLYGARAGRLHLISGGSGTGKTRIAAALSEGYKDEGWQALRVSPTGGGADNLRNAGGAGVVMTLAGLEHGVTEGRILLDPKTVIVLDEAGLIGAQSTERLLNMVEQSGARLVAMRGSDQLAPYEAAPMFQAFEARIGRFELGEQKRCENERVARALGQAGAAATDKLQAAHALHDAGVLKTAGSRKGAVSQLVADYVADPHQDKVLLAHSRADVATINAEVRRVLDQETPERMEGHDPSAAVQEGSIGDLRIGDKIALTSYYEAARMRAGQSFEVVSKDEGGVLLRAGTGEGARYIRFEGEDAGFEYRFDFATTVHGSTGRSIESVHMMVTEGMSRNIFATGAKLHRHDLNLVLPVPEERREFAMMQVLQTDGTARSVLDYGFDAAYGAREAVKGRAYYTASTGNINATFGKLHMWMGLDDKLALPTGAGIEAEAEVIAAHILDQGAAPEGPVNTNLRYFTAQLSDPEEWRKFQQKFPRTVSAQADRMALEKAGAGSDGAALPTARVLARGAIIADMLENEPLSAQFARGLDLYGARVDLAREAGELSSLEPALERVEDAVMLPDPAVREAREAAYQENKKAGIYAPRYGYFRPRNLIKLATMGEAEAARKVLNAFVGGGRPHSLTQDIIEAYQTYRGQSGAVQEMVIPDQGPKIAPDVKRLPMPVEPKVAVELQVPVTADVVEAPNEVAQTPKPAQEPDPVINTDDLATSLSSQVSFHIDGEDPVHQDADLKGRIRSLLERVPSDFKGTQKAAQVAKAMAVSRATHKIREEVNDKFNIYPAFRVKTRYAGSNPLLLSPYGADRDDAPKYDAALETAVRSANLNESIMPTEADDAIGIAAEYTESNGSETEKELSKTLIKANGYDDLPEAGSVRGRRKEVLKQLADPKLELYGDKAEAKLAEVYKAFSQREVEQLITAVPEASRSLVPEQAQDAPGSIAGGLLRLFKEVEFSPYKWDAHREAVHKEVTRSMQRSQGMDMD